MMRDGVVEEGEVVLSCGLSSTRVLAEALGCMFSSAHRGEEVMVSSVGEGAGGLRFTAEEFGCLQACALLERDSFSHFSCADEKLSIRVNLNELIDCLNIFGGIWDKSLTALKIEYRGYGNPLELTMQEKDATIKSSLAAIDGSILNDFRFLGSDVMTSVILQSDVLRDALLELDYAGATVAELHLSPEMPKLKFQSTSVTGASCMVQFPDPELSTQIFTSFRSRKQQVSTYRLSLLRRCLRALSQSDSTRLRMNTEGMLSLVVKLKFPGSLTKSSCYLEFLVVAEEINASDAEDDRQT